MSHLRVFIPQGGRGLGGVIRTVGNAAMPYIKKQIPAVRRVLKRKLKRLARRGLKTLGRTIKRKLSSKTQQKGGAFKRRRRTRRTTSRRRTIGRARDIFM